VNIFWLVQPDFVSFHKIRLSQILAKKFSQPAEFYKSQLVSAGFRSHCKNSAKPDTSHKFFSASRICKKKSGCGL